MRKVWTEAGGVKVNIHINKTFFFGPSWVRVCKAMRFVKGKGLSEESGGAKEKDILGLQGIGTYQIFLF